MNKEEFVYRFNYAMKIKNITQYSLSKQTGINKGSLSSYMSGKYLPKQDKIHIIAKVLEVNPDWLMCNSDKITDEVTYSENNGYCFFDASVSAGIPQNIESNSSFDRVDIPDMFLGRYAGHKDIIVLKVNGDSMNKIIPDGSFITVLTNVSLKSLSSEDIVVFSHDYEYGVKTFINDKKNRKYIFRPSSYDSCFEDLIFDYDNCDNLNIIGKVIMYNVML